MSKRFCACLIAFKFFRSRFLSDILVYDLEGYFCEIFSLDFIASR